MEGFREVAFELDLRGSAKVLNVENRKIEKQPEQGQRSSENLVTGYELRDGLPRMCGLYPEGSSAD